MKAVAIIGAGITGLTAAFRLRGRNVPVTVYEAGPRTGGVIQTIRREGYLAECGPNAILETSPRIGELIDNAGLRASVLYSDPRAGKRFVVRDGRPVPLPASPAAFCATHLFSLRAKLRLLKEPFIRPAPETEEESVAEFVRRRLGPEFLDYAINPFVAGVYAGNPDRLSVRHAFPRLHAVEQRYGSLILGQLLGARERRRRGETSKQNARKLSFVSGLQTLTDTLHAWLTDAVRLQTPVIRIAQMHGRWAVTARSAAGEETREYASVLFAGPAHKLAGIRIDAERYVSVSPLNLVQYPPVASVTLGFRREDVAHPLDGFGALVPKVEQFRILGTIFASSLFPYRAPAEHVALTSFIGGARAPELALRTHDQLVELTLADLRRLLGVRGRPTFAHTCVFPRAIPQYEVGFGRFKTLMNEIESRAPGFFLAGHYRDGISLADSIVSGHAAADRIESYLEARTETRGGAPEELPTSIAA